MTELVLVIDDDGGIRQSLSILLKSKGHSVVLATTGAEGFERFVEHHPSIVMCDMIMPGHEGVETIRKIRELDAEVAIIAMSGSILGGPASFLLRAQEAGANRCLEKPFEMDDLFAVMTRPF